LSAIHYQALQAKLSFLLNRYPDLLRHRVLDQILYRDKLFPLPLVEMGSQDPRDPCLLLVSGVHGLEKIGVEILLTIMQTLAALGSWDHGLQTILRRIRIVFYPFANPVGILRHTRATGDGIDMMRNAALEGQQIRWYQLYAGHRLSRFLPWYRGKAGEPCGIEAQSLMQLTRDIIGQSIFTLSLDIHSGFGQRDRLWFPFAYTQRAFPQAGLIYRLKDMLKEALPHHVYRIEPQSTSYRTHGDLWDYLYLRHQDESHANRAATFLPLTLELGSWLWLKKNPRQLFLPFGTFDPILPHRRQRTLRRHWALFDFLLRLVSSHKSFESSFLLDQQEYDRLAREKWFPHQKSEGLLT
jgi:hypothetical protein